MCISVRTVMTTPSNSRQNQAWQRDLSKYRRIRIVWRRALADWQTASARFKAECPRLPVEVSSRLSPLVLDNIAPGPVTSGLYLAEIRRCLRRSRRAIASFVTWNEQVGLVFEASGAKAAGQLLSRVNRHKERCLKKLMNRKAPNLLAVSTKLSICGDEADPVEMTRIAADLRRLENSRLAR